MKKIVTMALAAMLLASPVLAATQSTIATNGLSDAQIADLNAKAAALVAANLAQPVTPTTPTIETVSKYVSLGQEIGAGLAATAKELGVEVNSFAQTPIGRMATAIIVFKLIGKQAIGVIFGLLWFAVLIPTWLYFFRRMCIIKAKEWITETAENGKKRTIRRLEYIDEKTDLAALRWGMVFILAVCCCAGFVMIFS